MGEAWMSKTVKLMANVFIVGFVVGRVYNEWQHRGRTLTVRTPRGPRPLPRL